MHRKMKDNGHIFFWQLRRFYANIEHVPIETEVVTSKD